MKNTFKLFGVIALIAIIGFSMAACPEEKIETLTVTVTGLSPSTGYQIGWEYENAGNHHHSLTSNAEGTVTGSLKSDGANQHWGKNVYIYYGVWPAVNNDRYISKITYPLKSGSLTLNATTDFNLRQ